MKNLLNKWRKNTEPLILEEILPSGKEEIVSDVLKDQYKKIAEFMGYFYVSHNEGSDLGPGWYYSKHPKNGFICRNTKTLNFKYDWQMLMRVVLKIEALVSQRFGGFKVTIIDDCCTIQANLRRKENTYSKSYCSKTKLNSVYESVILFIDWYNSNKV